MGAGRPCSGIGGAEEEHGLKSSSQRWLHRVANGPNVMCLRIRSLPDPLSSSLNSPLFGISHSDQLWTLLVLARVVFGIRQPNQSSNSALSDREQGDGRPSLCGKASIMISLCRKQAPEWVSGSGPEDSNLDFPWSNRMSALESDKRIRPTIARQR
jgi:hypothetical protein